MRTASALVLAALTAPAIAQELVPNPGFEQVLLCPDFQSQLDHTAFWFDPSEGGTPDYYHACATDPWFATPESVVGFQATVDGEAYAGIFLWFANVLLDWREFIEVQLADPLVTGRCYHLRLHANLADYSGRTTDAIGVRFYPDSVLLADPFPPGDAPHIELAPGTFLTREDWTVLEGDYIADGGERFLMIGNYRWDAQTSTQVLTGGPPNTGNFAYALVDSVSLTPCIELGLDRQAAPAWYPVVQDGVIRILGDAPTGASYKLMDATGRTIAEGRLLGSAIAIPEMAGACLLLECTTSEERSIFKLGVP